jgi:hypothetical protein
MNAASSNPVQATPASTEWNWRAELNALDATIEHVASRAAWNWREALAEIEADLDRLASRVMGSASNANGLQGLGAPSTERG